MKGLEGTSNIQVTDCNSVNHEQKEGCLTTWTHYTAKVRVSENFQSQMAEEREQIAVNAQYYNLVFTPLIFFVNCKLL